MEEFKTNWIFNPLLLVFCSVSVAWLGSIGIIGLLLIMLSLLVLLIQRPLINLTKAEKLFVCSMVLFPIATLISMAVHDTDSFKYFDNTSRLLMVLPVFFAVRSLKFKEDYFFWGIVLSAILIGSIALYQSQILGISRVYGFISYPPNPITFGNAGMMLGILSVFTFSVIKARIGWYALPLVGLAVVLGVLASLLSGTRGGWISLPFIVSVIFYWIFGRQKRYLIISFISVVIFFLLASLLLPMVGDRITSAWGELTQILQGHWTTGSVGLRIQMWYAGVLIFLDSPLIGAGLGEYFEFKKGLINLGIISPKALSFPFAHNELFHYLAEMGLLGFVPLVLLYLGWLYLPTKYIKCKGQIRDLAYMALAIAIFRIDIGLTEVQFNYHFTSLFYVMLFGITAGFMCREVQPNSRLTTK